MKMKRFFWLILMAFCMSHFLQADEAEVVVKVALETPAQTRDAQARLAEKAQADAVRKYLKTHDANLPETVVGQCCAEASKFIDDMELDGSYKWIQLSADLWQISGEYTVELETDKINKYLKSLGVSVQGNLEIVIMEEPPSLGSMKLQGEAINAIREFYTNFQRRIRDYILKHTDQFGLDVKLLEDNDLYEEYKTLDATLVGVYYDVERANFVINQDLLKAVRSNNPETVVLYYRLETLDYDSDTQTIRVTISLSFKDLEGGITKSIGSAPYALKSNANTAGTLMDDIGLCAEKALASLMNANAASAKINTLITEIRNAVDQPSGPIRLTINAEVFDAKNRKKNMYAVKKQLSERGYADNDKIKTSNTSLTAELKPEFNDAEAFYFENLSEILEELGVEVDDDKVFFSKGKITIKP